MAKTRTEKIDSLQTKIAQLESKRKRNPHYSFRRGSFPNGEVRHTHRARQYQPRNRSDKSTFAPTGSTYIQAAKLAERGTGIKGTFSAT